MPHRRFDPHQPAPRAETPVRAEGFRAALQTRVLGRAGLGDEDSFRVLLLERGSAVLRGTDRQPLPVAGRLVGWFPWREDMRLDLAAGAQGTHLLLGIATLNRVLQRRPEAAQLQFMASRPSLLRLEPDDPAAEAVAACFAGILAETLRPGPMSSAAVDSLLHVLLVHLYRGQAHGGAAEGQAGGGQALAGQFTALVEGHFRDRWPVARYAAELGISRDRLNDICIRAHGRPPARLIRERLLLEARIYLETSPLALGEIAGVLGFASASQFSRFFTDMTGQTPGRYRSSQSASAMAEGAERTAIHDWP
ncbi:AraC family transcriptional regulator [Polymorphum gilvum]|uniref:Transcriptional regulator, AraC family n=1 Tax=Polymorphum gilvum (strain LMG 25793 / CGMCC 1.9160 / SL003B-26A1) TaxID=991905 RepID=F2J5K3_POLGS|nr:AraC family transcriptional regulator [Polymorphum gilvum]ADZ72373.1 Transcriptional regulator, AraC family [Polymorphum gilvum SL003B-26A1]